MRCHSTDDIGTVIWCEGMVRSVFLFSTQKKTVFSKCIYIYIYTSVVCCGFYLDAKTQKTQATIRDKKSNDDDDGTACYRKDTMGMWVGDGWSVGWYEGH